MEHCIDMPEQEFLNYLKWMKEMIDTRYEFVICYPEEDGNQEILGQELPAELHEHAVIYS